MRIRAIGDVSISRAISPEVPKLLHGDPAEEHPDLVIGNLEIPLTDKGWPADKVSVSRSAPENVESYRALGADVWSLGTNHALDWGIPGLLQTMETLRQNDIAFVGAGEDLASSRRPEILSTEDGSSVAVLNFCSTLPSGSAATARKPGVSPLRILQSFEYEAARLDEQPGSAPRMTTWPLERDLDDAAQLVADLAEQHDVVVVCLHWGVAWPFLPPNQFPLADYQPVVASRLVEAGAKVIIGTHSHCLHPIEFIGDAVVLYSLGNFMFHPGEGGLEDHEKRVTPSMHPILRTGPWNDGALADVIIERGAVTEVLLSPIVLGENGEPRPADGAEAARIIERMKELSPHASVRVDTYGRGVVSR